MFSRVSQCFGGVLGTFGACLWATLGLLRCFEGVLNVFCVFGGVSRCLGCVAGVCFGSLGVFFSCVFGCVWGFVVFCGV